MTRRSCRREPRIIAIIYILSPAHLARLLAEKNEVAPVIIVRPSSIQDQAYGRKDVQEDCPLVRTRRALLMIPTDEVTVALPYVTLPPSGPGPVPDGERMNVGLSPGRATLLSRPAMALATLPAPGLLAMTLISSICCVICFHAFWSFSENQRSSLLNWSYALVKSGSTTRCRVSRIFHESILVSCHNAGRTLPDQVHIGTLRLETSYSDRN